MKVFLIVNIIGKILLISGVEIYRVEKVIFIVCRRFDLKVEIFVIMICVLIFVKKRDGEIIIEVNRIYIVFNNLDKIDRIYKIFFNIYKYELEDLEKEVKKI